MAAQTHLMPRAFTHATRVQKNVSAGMEKRLLVWMARRMPAWVNSDHLTILGFLGQLGTGFCYALASRNKSWLLASIGFLALNWFGDSMDGTLARVRQQQRPRYGFYVDHMLDSIGAVALMEGLALSGYMSGGIALTLLVLFLLLSVQSYLATYTVGEFQMSFGKFGPTELRFLLAAGSLALFRWTQVAGRWRLFDVGGAAGAVGMTAALVISFARNAARLYGEEKLK